MHHWVKNTILPSGIQTPHVYLYVKSFLFGRLPGEQLRLFDIRLRQTEIHVFGWKQESSESQSALINQAWSPDGLYLSSGSADPKIHIFDIRYNGSGPSQSVQAHQKRVFKAVWHQSMPLLTSISSDLNIGLHRFTWSFYRLWWGWLLSQPLPYAYVSPLFLAEGLFFCGVRTVSKF